MTKQEILKLIKWDNETKTLTIESDNQTEELDISIKVKNNIKGDVAMENIGGNNDQGNISGSNDQLKIGGDNIQKNIDGDNYQWDIGGNNDQRNIDGNNYQFNINGNNHQWNINGNNEQRDISGNNEQRNIDGDNYQWDIGGNNDQRNIDGNNYQFNINGNNHQWNINGNNEQRDISGNNEQRNIDGDNEQRDISGYSVNSKHYIRNGVETLNVDTTDNVFLHSITKKTRGNLSFIEGMNWDNSKIYLVKTPTISYHSWISMEDAKEGWKNKRNRLIEGVKDFVKECKETNKISIRGFMEATGSCKPGTIAWLKRASMEYKDDLSDVYDFDYAIEKFREFPANELMGILEVFDEANR